MPPNHLSEEEVFQAARRMESAAARQDYLDHACGDDAELRASVEALLGALEASESFLESPAPESPAEKPTAQLPVAERPGDAIGPYKLLQQIGEGGMGVVYMAEQSEPLERRVALKIIKPGMDTRQVIARFEAERQALAMMDHPNIAKALDAGMTDSGRPYFVMELVKGVPITKYCDEHNLTPRERLELFLPVCQAVQHAHQKGIIHRDIKPSNVLVAHYDDQPMPKVIDFGVAKAIDHRLTEKTMFTEFGQVLGTFEYMSPEQARLNQWDVDTRTDIYSLGVLLYELLSGETPFDRQRLRSAAFDEILRIIREEEPPRPSTRVSTSQSLPTIAANRKTEPKKLSMLIHGELDWIVMKALEKDRTRRYETVSKLAEDVDHFLNNEAVEACPPSATYRFRKFAQRNKSILVTIAIVAAALIGATTVSVRQANIARQAETLAKSLLESETSARREAQAAIRRATTGAVRSEQVAQFLKDMLAAAGPSVARGRDATVLKEILQETAARVESDLEDQPEVQGDLWFTIGKTYRDIADFHSAIPMYQRAVEIYRHEPGDSNLKLALTLARLGESQSFLGDVPTGQRNAQLGLDMARTIGDPEALAFCLRCRGRSTGAWGQASQEAEPYYREALSILQKLGNHPLDEAKVMKSLSDCGISVDEAESFARQSVKVFEEHLGRNDPYYADAMLVLGTILLDRGKIDEAEAVLRKTWEKWQQIFDDVNPYNLEVVPRFLALAMELQGDRERARALFFDPLPADRHPHLHRVYCNRLFGYLLNLNRISEAERVADEIAERIDELGKDHVETPAYEKLLAEMRSRLEDSGPWLTPAAELLRRQDFTSFDALCKRMAIRFQDTDDPIAAERTCRVCLLRPGVVNPEQLPRRVLIASLTDKTTPQDTLPWNYSACGLLAYREGDAERALTYAKESQARIDVVNAPLRPEYIATLNHSVIALASHKLGQPEAAQAALRHATQLFARMGDDGLSSQIDVVMANEVYQEAKQKIDGHREEPTE